MQGFREGSPHVSVLVWPKNPIHPSLQALLVFFPLGFPDVP